MDDSSSRRPRAVFMAFGTKGDVYPIAAIAAALACDQKQYDVVLITHSAHESLTLNMEARNVSCFLISSPPVLSNHQNKDSAMLAFSLQKKAIERTHREECLSAIERAFRDGPRMEGDFIVINFFALEGWSLAELFRVRCVVAAPYVVPYSPPSSFEHQFRKELPLLYRCLQEAPLNKASWKDVVHWMWPLFTEEWNSWRSNYLNLSPWPFTDPVTGLPMWHDWPESTLLLYGFSKEVVECPGYWPSNVKVCGFWFLPLEWQFSCTDCSRISAVRASGSLNTDHELCANHANLQNFLMASNSCLPIFIGLSSIGRRPGAENVCGVIDASIDMTGQKNFCMGFLKNSRAFLLVLKAVLENTNYRFILFSASYEPLDASIQLIAEESSGSNKGQLVSYCEDRILLFEDRLFCFSGTIPYRWLFPRCAVAVHHGGSGSTAAALHAGIPQVICPFILDQFYWAEKMSWLGVAPESIQSRHLLPDDEDETSIAKAANVLKNAIMEALSLEIKARASEIAERLSSEDGVGEALKVLKEHVINQNKPEG